MSSFSAKQQPATAPARNAAMLPAGVRVLVPGILAAVGLAVVAQSLGKAFPIIGGPIFGILIGILVRNLSGLDPVLSPGVSFSSKKVLQAAIVAFGGSLSLGQVWQTGTESLSVMLVSLASGLVVSLAAGRLMGVPWRLSSLIGAGTSICGASAIAAVAPVVAAEEEEVSYSISTVFLFNILAVFLFPLIGHALQLSDTAFGLWSGTAVNDTSSVIATGFAWSNEAGAYATIVKLARSTMILPVSLGFAGWMIFKGSRSGAAVKWQQTIPWFIFGFLGMAVLNSVGVLGNSGPWLASAAKFGITMALVAVGLNADFTKIRSTGFRPLVLGLLTWVAVATVSMVQILVSAR